VERYRVRSSRLEWQSKVKQRRAKEGGMKEGGMKEGWGRAKLR
jgi:hypothetical protein